MKRNWLFIGCLGKFPSHQHLPTFRGLLEALESAPAYTTTGTCSHPIRKQMNSTLTNRSSASKKTQQPAVGKKVLIATHRPIVWISFINNQHAHARHKTYAAPVFVNSLVPDGCLSDYCNSTLVDMGSRWRGPAA